jgi:hypothetical protein
MYTESRKKVYSTHFFFLHNFSLDLNKQELIEVKVKLKEKHDRQITNYHKFKLRNWWCQSFLVGVNEVYVGLRNDDGFVDEIEQVNLKSMVQLGKVRTDSEFSESKVIIFYYFFQILELLVSFNVSVILY